MKDLRAAKQILGMRRVRKGGNLRLNQKRYLAKIVERFDCLNARKINLPLDAGFSLSKTRSPDRTAKEDEKQSICFGNWEFNVCYDLYQARDCPCNGSGQ